MEGLVGKARVPVKAGVDCKEMLVLSLGVLVMFGGWV